MLLQVFAEPLFVPCLQDLTDLFSADPQAVGDVVERSLAGTVPVTVHLNSHGSARAVARLYLDPEEKPVSGLAPRIAG